MTYYPFAQKRTTPPPLLNLALRPTTRAEKTRALFASEARILILSRCVPDPETGCWLWPVVSDKGYGTVSSTHNTSLAHRLSYWAFTEEVPGEQLVCHTCDVMHCVNPYHFFLGTASMNTADMRMKNRSGWQNGKIPRKLHFGDAATICFLVWRKGLTSTEVGRLFSITRQYVNMILRAHRQ